MYASIVIILFVLIANVLSWLKEWVDYYYPPSAKRDKVIIILAILGFVSLLLTAGK